MDIADYNDFISNLIKPDVFLSQISSLTEKLPHILDDFIKYYVLYNKNPEIDEYQQVYENIIGNIQNIFTELSKISSNIRKNIDDINTKLLKIDTLIQKQKEINKDLKRSLGIIENDYDGSGELISDYKKIYNLNYLQNFSLFIGIIFACILMSKTFKPPVFSQVSQIVPPKLK